MKCYIMFCVANLMKNMMTLFKIYHRNTLSSISVNNAVTHMLTGKAVLYGVPFSHLFTELQISSA